MTPAISVLMPAHDAEAHLEEAVRSTLGQTLTDLELIVVDDASTDGTGPLLAALAREDRRMQVLTCATQHGISAALNLGLLHCRAPLIARLDADDIALPERLERQLEMLERNPALAAVGSAVEIFPRERLTPGMCAYERWLNSLQGTDLLWRERLIESPLVHPAATIRAAALRACGGWRSEGWPEDYALWLRMFERGLHLDNHSSILLRWRDHPGRLTRTHSDYSRSAHLSLKALHLARTLCAPPRARCIIWGAGPTGRALARELAALGVEVACLLEVDRSRCGKRSLHAPIIHYEELGPFENTPLVAAVGNECARREIRTHLSSLGWREGDEYLCIA